LTSKLFRYTFAPSKIFHQTRHNIHTLKTKHEAIKDSKSITNRESQSLEKYLQEIGREGLINAEEEVKLARKIREGDQVALDRLTKANLRFVVSVAKQYQNQGLSFTGFDQ
jgi:DNA-directed RNA polymerase sigma subunit (sigma70/sigma32)